MGCLILCGLYLTGGVAHLGNVSALPPDHAWPHNITLPMNPYGIVEAGWQSPTWHRLDATLAARHMSGSGTDYGTNTVEVRVTWRPFRSAP